jgi:hypothetical protein
MDQDQVEKMISEQPACSEKLLDTTRLSLNQPLLSAKENFDHNYRFGHVLGEGDFGIQCTQQLAFVTVYP